MQEWIEHQFRDKCEDMLDDLRRHGKAGVGNTTLYTHDIITTACEDGDLDESLADLYTSYTGYGLEESEALDKYAEVVDIACKQAIIEAVDSNADVIMQGYADIAIDICMEGR